MDKVEELLIPLFPLEAVLFPGQRLPLHIFEERYKVMIRECLECPAPREFGVVLAKENAIVNVGCTARVASVTRRYDDGRMDILAVGCRRFEVLFVDESREYLRAAAQFFQDEESEIPDELCSRVRDLHRQVLEFIPTEGDEPEAAASVEPLPLSFRLTGPLPLDVDFRQMLLVLRSEADRLERVSDYYKQLLPRLRLASRARAKAGGNGHCR